MYMIWSTTLNILQNQTHSLLCGEFSMPRLSLVQWCTSCRIRLGPSTFSILSVMLCRKSHKIGVLSYPLIVLPINMGRGLSHYHILCGMMQRAVRMSQEKIVTLGCPTHLQVSIMRLRVIPKVGWNWKWSNGLHIFGILRTPAFIWWYPRYVLSYQNLK